MSRRIGSAVWLSVVFAAIVLTQGTLTARPLTGTYDLSAFCATLEAPLVNLSSPSTAAHHALRLPARVCQLDGLNLCMAPDSRPSVSSRAVRPSRTSHRSFELVCRHLSRPPPESV